MSSYFGDTYYEVWRSGRNADRLDPDRVEQHRWNGETPEEAASAEMRRWDQQAQQRREQEAQEQEYFERQAYEEEQRRAEEATYSEQSPEHG